MRILSNETVLKSADIVGWPGAIRNDLPASYIKADVMPKDQETSTQPVNPLGVYTSGISPPRWAKVVLKDDFIARHITYQYVNTGRWAVSTSNVLWSDGASWCTMAAFWKFGRAGLAHVAPGKSTAEEHIHKLIEAFNGLPTEIHLVTTPDYFENPDGFVLIKDTIEGAYQQHYKKIKVYLICGYDRKDWEQKHQLGVDPKSGAYPVFNV
jgi:hypothetical protein